MITLSSSYWEIIQIHEDDSAGWVGETMPPEASGKRSMSIERAGSDPPLFTN